MTMITQAQRDQMASEGLIAGEQPKRSLSNLRPASIEPETKQAPTTNMVVNNIDDKVIHKILEQNAELIKQMAVQLKSMSINNEQATPVNTSRATTFRVKRDDRGMIESVEVKYSGFE